MLKPAKLYEQELNKKIQDTALDPDNKWYHRQYLDLFLTIDDSSWSKLQLVSVNSKGEVIGYFKACYRRPENFVDAIMCINLDKSNKILFAKDLYNFLILLTKEQNVPKLMWAVVIGNPIEKAYDTFCERHGGRIVGVYKKDTLINGEYYDMKLYEWLNPKVFPC